MEKRVQVNIEKCKDISKIIKNLKIRPSFYKRKFLSFKSDKETKLRSYFFSVAICHQTHGLINKKLNLIGWDYLEYVFLNFAKNKSELLDPNYLAKESVKSLSNRLEPIFSDDGNPKKCTLDRLEERSSILIEAAKILLINYKGKVSRLVDSTDGFLIKDGKGLYESLGKFGAYSDHLKKKSTYFIKLLIDAGILKIKDPENFVPIMDYHMQRVLLRIGCVEIIDKNLKQKLIQKEKINSDEDIRNASAEAVKFISKFSGVPTIKINDFLWPLGRSCCKEKRLCIDKSCNKSPCTFYLVVQLKSHKKCVFQDVCQGSLNEEYGNIWEPIVETHYY